MRKTAPPFFLSWFSPRFLYCSIPSVDNAIYLTFDDGPVPEATPEILEILGKTGVKATFFMVGDNVRKHPELFRQILAEGHATGNHTFHHLNGWHTTTGSYIHDVERCNELVQSPLFRPPYGRFTPSQYFMLRKRYRFVLWSVLTWDFHKNVSPEQCLRHATNDLRPGAVIVFHDNVKSIANVRYALPRFIEHCRSAGFRFDTIPA